jgi:hypothetical protein
VSGTENGLRSAHLAIIVGLLLCIGVGGCEKKTLSYPSRHGNFFVGMTLAEARKNLPTEALVERTPGETYKEGPRPEDEEFLIDCRSFDSDLPAFLIFTRDEHLSRIIPREYANPK